MQQNQSESKELKENIDEKFKALYDLMDFEYKRVLERNKKAEEKAMRLFTIVNVMIPLLVTVFIKDTFWNYFIKNSHVLFSSILLFLIVLLFLFLTFAWLDLFKLLQTKESHVLPLHKNNRLEDIVYDDEKDINYFYWLVYKTEQDANEKTNTEVDKSYESLKTAYIWIKRAFMILCIGLFMIFLFMFNKVLS